MPKEDPKTAIRRLLRAKGEVRVAEVVEASGVSRQAASRHLRSLVEAGVLLREGAARSTRYRRAGAQATWSFPRPGLEEDRVWQRLIAEWPPLTRCGGAAREVAQYAVTELVNNAVDHSSASTVTVRCGSHSGLLAIEVEDDGVGAFDHLRTALGLPSELEALQELSKGKVTTDPAHHTGEGIFFTSKAVDFFELRSGRLRWLVDNARGEHAILEAEPRGGTLVRIEVDPDATRPLQEVFEAYTRDFEFVRTRTVVKLFELGVRFVSRSEAKRLLGGLERFREVVLDFRGVEGIGQGFADEVFRVFADAHPKIAVLPEHMNDAIAFMVRRSLRRD